MKLFSRIATLTFLVVFFSLTSCHDDDNPYLADLDKAIDSNALFTDQKQNRIDSLKRLLTVAKTRREAYGLSMRIYQEYQYFSLDSSFVYIRHAIDLANKINDKDLKVDTQLSLAFLYNFSGMLSEALAVFNSYNPDSLPHDIRRNYYYLGLNIYNNLVSNTIDKETRKFYAQTKSELRDSALYYSSGDIVLLAEKLSDEGKHLEALSLCSKNLPDNLKTNEAGLRYFIISEIYGQLGHKDLQLKYLAMSSTASAHNAVRQYIALRKLAVLVSEKGDTKRAYRYIRHCVNDAKLCNSHTRILETSEILPNIATTAIEREQSWSLWLSATLSIITILSLALFYILCKLRKKNKKLNKARVEQNRDNEVLVGLNAQLNVANEKLSALNIEHTKNHAELKNLNEKLKESNLVKSVYITRFMNLCLDYISKMENYRKRLCKIANKRNFDELNDAIQSSRYINEEIADFYNNFDEAFLHIYPNFIEDINKLLRPEEQIAPKQQNRMTTETRIYALVKLGIHDSSAIQGFLRCSASTVYNYRTIMRNKAINRDKFEADVLSI